MTLKQISVFLENKQGTLAKATKVFGDNGIDLIALSIADTADFGIMRCIVNKPEQALTLLAEEGFAASTTEVLAVEVPDQPGGLSSVLALMDANELNVEYLYSFVRTPNENALIMFRVEDTEKCEALLRQNDIRLFSLEEILASVE